MKTPLPERYKHTTRLVIFTLAGGLLLFFILMKVFDGSFIARITSALLPFMIGAVIAFILKPICNRLDIWIGDWFANKVFLRRIQRGKTTEKRVRRRAEGISIAIALFIFVIVVAGLLWLVIPSLWQSINNLRQDFPGYMATLNNWLAGLSESGNPIGKVVYKAYQSVIERFTSGGSDILGGLLDNIFSILSTAGGVASTVVDFIVGALVTAASTVYILMNRKRFAAQANLIVHAIFKKNAAEWIVNETKFANRKFSEFLSGKLIDSLVVGILLYIAFLIFKIPNAPLIAVFMACCNMIPFFGPFIGAIPCGIIVLLANIGDPIRVLIFLAIVLVIQQLDGNILDPFIVGDNVGLPSFWVLFAVILFGDLFGFFGMLLGVPVFAVIYDIIRQLVTFGLKKRGEEQLMTNYNFIYHDPEEERAALKKRAAAIKAARKEARLREDAEREEAQEREIAIAQAAAAARAEAEAEAIAKQEAEALAKLDAEAEAAMAAGVIPGDGAEKNIIGGDDDTDE